MMLQALAAIPSIESEAVQQRLDRVRTYYELLNMPFEVGHLNSWLMCERCIIIIKIDIRNRPMFVHFLQALLAFITEHSHLFTTSELVS